MLDDDKDSRHNSRGDIKLVRYVSFSLRATREGDDVVREKPEQAGLRTLNLGRSSGTTDTEVLEGGIGCDCCGVLENSMPRSRNMAYCLRRCPVWGTVSQTPGLIEAALLLNIWWKTLRVSLVGRTNGKAANSGKARRN